MSTKRKHFPRPLGGGATKRWVLFHPAYLAKTRLLGARSSRYRGVSAGVPMECGSAWRYVHTYRGHVIKSPGRTCRLARVIRALVKINPVALRATRISVIQSWVAQQSRRKYGEHDNSSPVCWLKHFPNKEHVIRLSPVHPKTHTWQVDSTCSCDAGTKKLQSLRVLVSTHTRACASNESRRSRRSEVGRR